MAKLDDRSTIISIFDELTHGSRYSRLALDKMRKCKIEHKNAWMKIGVTGTGQKPCFRVVYDSDEGEKVFGSWWDMGDPLDRTDAINGNWSKARTGYKELEEFLAEKLNYNGPRLRST